MKNKTLPSIMLGVARRFCRLPAKKETMNEDFASRDLPWKRTGHHLKIACPMVTVATTPTDKKRPQVMLSCFSYLHKNSQKVAKSRYNGVMAALRNVRYETAAFRLLFPKS
jgi:hypothetical protein